MLGAASETSAVRRRAAATDPPAELVELGQPEPVGALDRHDRRLGDVDADLDHRRPHEHVELAVAEPGHLGVALGGLQPTVDEPDPERGEQRSQAFRLSLGGDRSLVVGFLDGGDHDERSVAVGGL